MENRISLNATQIADPIAESTCLNILGSSSTQHFQWGDTPICRKNRSQSSINLTDIKTSLHNNSSAICDRINTSRKSRIDQRVYADIQSKGLASRIVNYHEKGELINRSLSVNNLSGKSGKFPVVHLKKTELPCKAKQNNLSMTRIAPPEKSMFYGNTLSSILRSNSVVLHKSDEELSCENRPILHPPSVDNEIAPTRSVLEVLKEISRKRINSDELNHSESTKKYCNQERNSPSVVTPQNSNMNLIQNNKRQREVINNQHQNALSKKTNYLQDQHHSPEQLAKKRLCSYNNDITSSLSSSQIYTNKRKIYDQKIPETSFSTDDYKYAVPKRVEFNKQELRINQTTNIKSANITSGNEKVDDNLINASSPGFQSKDLLNSSNPERIISEKQYQTCQQGGASVCKQKLTLFNTNYADRIKIDDNKINKENGEFSEIAFVKPKKNITPGTKNLILKKTQTSKLALMLSGLRGDLYDNEDANNSNKFSEQSGTNEELKIIETSDSQNKLDLKTISSTTISIPSNNVANVASKSETFAINSDPCNSTPKSISSGAFNIMTTTNSGKISDKIIQSSTPSTMTGEKGTPIAKQSNLSETKITTNLTDTGLSKNIPVLGGFSFNFTSKEPKSLLSDPSSDSGLKFGNSPTVVPLTNIQHPLTDKKSILPHTTSTLPNNMTTCSSNITPLPAATNVKGVIKSDATAPTTFGSINSTPFIFSSGSSTSEVNNANIKSANSVESKHTLSTSTITPGSTSEYKNSAISFSASSIAVTPTVQTTSEYKNTNISFSGTSSATNQSNPTSTINFKFGAANVPETNSIGFGAAKNTDQTVDPRSSKEKLSAKPLISSNFGDAELSGQKSGGFPFPNSLSIASNQTSTGTHVFSGSILNSVTKSVQPSFSFGDNTNFKNVLSPNIPFKLSTPNNTDYNSQGALDIKQTEPFTFGSKSTLSNPKTSDDFSSNTRSDIPKNFSFGNFALSNPVPNAIEPFSFVSTTKSNDFLKNQNKTFSFGTNNIPSESNLFANSVTNTTASKGPFSFTSDNSLGKSSISVPNENAFSPAQTQTARPIRRATRRLQKS